MINARTLDGSYGVPGALEAICTMHCLKLTNISSGAGHDSMIMARVTRTGMIFVPSRNGKSHTPEERTEDADLVNGGNTLAEALVRLAH